jgi:hypothetical protein
MPEYPEYHPDYFTATVVEWKMLLKPEKFKQLIINSLQLKVVGAAAAHKLWITPTGGN